MSVLMVSSKTNPDKLAKAIIANVSKFKVAEVQAIGEAATYRAIKAIAIARKFFNRRKDDLICTPAFAKVKVNEEKNEFLAMNFIIGKA